jgi:hypothetical protein
MMEIHMLDKSYSTWSVLRKKDDDIGASDCACIGYIGVRGGG